MDASVPSGYTFLPVDKDYIEAFPVLIKRIQLVQNCIGTFLGYIKKKTKDATVELILNHLFIEHPHVCL